MKIQLNDQVSFSMINHYGAYADDSSVEIGFPTSIIPELLPYKCGDDPPTESVYSYVPLTVVADIIAKYKKQLTN